MSGRLFIVYLRQPGKNDRRDDPFWEFGSFGCTGCHTKNLLHPKRCQVGNGDRLAFVQGGRKDCRLLLITPPVWRVNHHGHDGSGVLEVRWDRSAQTFRYGERAPLLAGGEKDVPHSLPELGKVVNDTARSTAARKLASRFRARCRPVDALLERELVGVFDKAQTAATKEDFIERYEHALPWINPRMISQDRRKDYDDLLDSLRKVDGSGLCLFPKGKCRK